MHTSSIIVLNGIILIEKRRRKEALRTIAGLSLFYTGTFVYCFFLVSVTRSTPKKWRFCKRERIRMILISQFASPWFLLVLLALVAARTLASISQREMRGIFLHHQEYCRERAARVGAGGVERHHWVAHQTKQQCESSNGAHEWFVDQDAIEADDAFRARAENKVSATHVSLVGPELGIVKSPC